jgi:hypothetical protein
MIPQKDLALMANLVTYPLKAPTTPPTPLYTTLVEWLVQQKLYYFLEMQKNIFLKELKFFLEGN